MNLLIIFSILVNTVLGSAQDDRSLMLLNVKDIKTLKAKSMAFENTAKLKTACEFELEKNLIPKSCYLLKLSKDKIAAVDEACERSSMQMKNSMPLKGLSSKCSGFVQKKNADLKYTEAEVSPLSVF